MSFPHINLKTQQAHINNLTPRFSCTGSHSNFLKNLLPYPDNKKKHTPGLYIDKSIVYNWTFVFPEFQKEYLTVEIHKQFIFTKRKCISPQNIFVFLNVKEWMFNHCHVWSPFTKLNLLQNHELKVTLLWHFKHLKQAKMTS